MSHYIEVIKADGDGYVLHSANEKVEGAGLVDTYLVAKDFQFLCYELMEYFEYSTNKYSPDRIKIRYEPGENVEEPFSKLPQHVKDDLIDCYWSNREYFKEIEKSREGCWYLDEAGKVCEDE